MLEDRFGGWLGDVLGIKIRREDYGAGITTAETPKPLILTFQAVTEAARQIVDGLETAGPADSPATVSAPKGPVFMGLGQDREVLTLGGNLRGLKVGSNVIIPLRRVSGRSELGQEENATGEVIRLGGKQAQVKLIDPLTGRSRRLGTQYAVDIMRPIERL